MQSLSGCSVAHLGVLGSEGSIWQDTKIADLLTDDGQALGRTCTSLCTLLDMLLMVSDSLLELLDLCLLAGPARFSILQFLLALLD